MWLRPFGRYRYSWGAIQCAGEVDRAPGPAALRQPQHALADRRRTLRDHLGSGHGVSGADKLDDDPFLSHDLTLDEVDHGFDLMEDHDDIRSVIHFN